MSVELDPVELGFRRPFTQEVAETLRIRNPGKEPVIFKVKTTAPKQYCVRPNSGRIDAGENVEVSVLLQAMKEDPPLDAKCRDKFLVQSVAVSPDQETSNVAAVWSSLESKVKGSIEEKKIRVTFLPPLGSTPQHMTSSSASNTPLRNATTSGHGQEEPPAYSSPLPDTGTTRAQPSENLTTSVPPPAGVSQINNEPNPNSSDTNNTIGETKSSSTQGNVNTTSNGVASTIAAAASSVASAVPTSSDEVKAQLAEAQATISRLTKQIQEQGLRQRKAPASDSEEKSVAGQAQLAVQQAPGGVAVPVVAALCLLSFLLAYLFF